MRKIRTDAGALHFFGYAHANELRLFAWGVDGLEDCDVPAGAGLELGNLSL